MNFDTVGLPLLLSLVAGLSTVLGAFLFLQNFCKREHLSFFLGMSAGVMIHLSFLELLPSSVDRIGFFKANLFFFIGILIVALLDFLVPHHYIEKKIAKSHKVADPKLLSTGLIVTLGLIIHNLPEGMAVFASSYENIKLGILLTLAIAIHNIPEGIAVAAPIYYATLNKASALKFALYSGLAEPAGAIITYLIFRPYLSADLLATISSVVAGIMVYISLDELLPASYRDNQGHNSIVGISIGMMVVFISLLLFK